MLQGKLIKENSISEYNPNWLHRRVADDIEGLMGKTLTIIDAAITQGVQNKCVKDIIRKDFCECISWVFDHFVLQSNKDGFNQTPMDGRDLGKSK